MEVPRRSGKNRKFVGLESDGTSVVVHSLPIAERYFMCHSKAVLQQVSAVFCINIWIFSSNRKVCIVSIHFVIWQEIWKKYACRLPVVLQQVGVVVFLVPNMYYYYYLFTRIEWWGLTNIGAWEWQYRFKRLILLTFSFWTFQKLITVMAGTSYFVDMVSFL